MVFDIKGYKRKYAREHREQLNEYRRQRISTIADYYKKEYQKNPEKKRQRTREDNFRIKLEVFNAYSNGNIRCAGLNGKSCQYNCTDIDCLVLDHIDGNGAEERKKLYGKNVGGGTTFYKYLRNQGYPKGYQILCSNCNLKKTKLNHENWKHDWMLKKNPELKDIALISKKEDKGKIEDSKSPE